MKPLKEAIVIICSIVRNAERGLKANIPVIDSFCQYCMDFKIVIYENDSIDKTKFLLTKWADKDRSRIHILLNDTDASHTIPTKREVNCNPFYSYKRISKMTDLRNKYMDYVNNQRWDADYMIVVDLDVAQLNLKGMLSSFSSKIEWDAVTAFGYSTSPRLCRRYHDTYALTEVGNEEKPQTEKIIKELSYKYRKLKSSDQWVKVFSAFGGLAIYRFEAVKGLRYETIRNDDRHVEVRCEHYSLYQQMAAHGYDRVYINPAMRLKYQRVTVKIILQSMIRMLNKQKMGGGVKIRK